MRRPPAVAAALLASMAAGCGGAEDDQPRVSRDSDRPAVAPAPGGGAGPTAFQRFQQCLRDNGFELPDVPPGGGGAVEPPPEEVRRKCERHLPRGLPAPRETPQQVPLR